MLRLASQNIVFELGAELRPRRIAYALVICQPANHPPTYQPLSRLWCGRLLPMSWPRAARLWVGVAQVLEWAIVYFDYVYFDFFGHWFLN